MEPLSVEPLDLDSPEDDQTPEFEDMPDISEEIHKQITEVHQEMIEFKQELYNDIVLSETTQTQQNPLGIGAMATFHALYLQCLAYCLSLLDSKRTAVPIFSNTDIKYHFDTIINHINSIKHKNSDADILLYNLFFKLTTQHPFSFNKI
jgi:hypothetical protein